MRRRLRFKPSQFVGLFAMAAIVALAGFGVFDETWTTERASDGTVSAIVTYPRQLPYSRLHQLSLSIRNEGSAALDSVVVKLDSSLVGGFLEVQAVPAFRSAYDLVLQDLRGGQTVGAVIQMRAEAVGTHTGDLTIGEASALRIPIRITVLP